MNDVAQQTHAPDAAAVRHVLQLATGFIVSGALGVAARLGIADHLAQGPRSTADLAAATGANEDALYRVLRALAMLGVFVEPSPRTFALTPPADLIRTGVPGSVRDMVLWMCDAYIMKHIIHDWDDERAIQILRNIRAALDGKRNGKVMLLEGVIGPGNNPDIMKLIDLEMLVLPGAGNAPPRNLRRCSLAPGSSWRALSRRSRLSL